MTTADAFCCRRKKTKREGIRFLSCNNKKRKHPLKMSRFFSFPLPVHHFPLPLLHTSLRHKSTFAQICTSHSFITLTHIYTITLVLTHFHAHILTRTNTPNPRPRLPFNGRRTLEFDRCFSTTKPSPSPSHWSCSTSSISTKNIR